MAGKAEAAAQSNLMPLAVGLVIGGTVMLAVPDITAAGLMFAGIGLLVINALPIRFIWGAVALVLAAFVIDGTVADLGPNLIDGANIQAPDLGGVSVEVGQP